MKMNGLHPLLEIKHSRSIRKPKKSILIKMKQLLEDPRAFDKVNQAQTEDDKVQMGYLLYLTYR